MKNEEKNAKKKYQKQKIIQERKFNFNFNLQ